MVVQAEHL